MHPLLISTMSGFVATAAMGLVFYCFAWQGFQHGEMLRAVGSQVSSQQKTYPGIGLALYAFGGLLMAVPYYYALNFLAFDTIITNIGFAGLLGTIQGWTFSYFVASKLPTSHLARYRGKYFLPIVFAQCGGHIAYGLSIGVLIGTYFLHGTIWMLRISAILLAAFGIIAFAIRGKSEYRY
jgi:hypothetical protein